MWHLSRNGNETANYLRREKLDWEYYIYNCNINQDLSTFFYSLTTRQDAYCLNLSEAHPT